MWAHDTDMTDSRKGHCGPCNVDPGKAWVLVDPSGDPGQGDELPESARHANGCAGKDNASKDKAPAAKQETPAPASQPAANGSPVAGEATVPAPAPTTTTDPFSGFIAQIVDDRMANRPAVDPADVQRMVTAAVDATVFPSTTVYQPAESAPVVIEGAHASLADVLLVASLRIHLMLVGPAGTGKSTLAESAAEALGLDFYAISCHPAMQPSAMLGFIDATGTYRDTMFRRAYEHGGVFLIDEIDNCHPSSLAALNAALSNGRMGFPDNMVKRHPDLVVIASANTYGRGADAKYVGRSPMDAATRDRFAMLTVGEDEALETELCKATGLDGGRVGDVLSWVRKARANAVRENMAVVVSPRGAVRMCKLLAAGKIGRAHV